MSLKVGTIEELEAQPEKKTRPIRSKSGGGSNNGNGRNRGGGGGDNRSDDDNLEQKEEFKPDKYRVGMGLILLAVLMTFGGLIGAYVVIATNQPAEWKTFNQFNLPFQTWFSSVLIIISSVFYEIAKRNLLAGNQVKAGKLFLITSVLGMIFIASQILSWFNLVNLGYYASGNPYAGFFYILTAIHALHVLGGIISLTFIVLKTRIQTDNADELLKRQWFATVVGWYWHCLGVLWIILFLLLGFYK